MHKLVQNMCLTLCSPTLVKILQLSDVVVVLMYGDWCCRCTASNTV